MQRAPPSATSCAETRQTSGVLGLRRPFLQPDPSVRAARAAASAAPRSAPAGPASTSVRSAIMAERSVAGAGVLAADGTPTGRRRWNVDRSHVRHRSAGPSRGWSRSLAAQRLIASELQTVVDEHRDRDHAEWRRQLRVAFPVRLALSNDPPTGRAHRPHSSQPAIARIRRKMPRADGIARGRRTTGVEPRTASGHRPSSSAPLADSPAPDLT